MMESTAKQNAKTPVHHSQAESHPNKTWYSVDEMIDAFNHGKQAATKAVQREADKNEKKAMKIAERFLDELLGKYKIAVKSIHLDVSQFSDFKAIFIIPSRVFLSEKKFEEITELLSEYYSLYNTSDFSISFYFMPHSSDMNKEAMVADGFSLTFVNG